MEDNRDRIPAEYRPLSAWAYFGYEILFAIPLVGFICLIVFALSSSNRNLRSFARSYFCVYIILIVVCLVLALSGTAAGLFSTWSEWLSR